ncbi:MAG TPA: 30S ribosomal protein S5 [Alphaproteobacteria bacterium]|nr:30S ribosomal protein S5 [Alphaproteobacteria bacterium]
MAIERDNKTYVDKLVATRRVAKVVKGGRRFSFSTLIVVGDEQGKVGFGSGKAQEVPEAVKKATDSAKKTMVKVAMKDNRTIHHHMEGRFGGAKVIMRPAPSGTGIIAGGPMRAVFEAMGMKDIVAKSLGSNNPYNMIRATFDAFSKFETPRMVASKRGKKVSDLGFAKSNTAEEAAE